MAASCLPPPRGSSHSSAWSRPPSICIAALLLLLATCLHHAAAQIPNVVVELDKYDFEDRTQAASGQTAGVWFVLFNDPLHFRFEQVATLWKEASMREDKEAIFAEVVSDSIRNRELWFRFIDIQPPAAVLFRDQRMYVYPRPLHEDGVVEMLHKFWESGYLSVEAQPVPGSVDAYEAMKRFEAENRGGGGLDIKTIGYCILALFVGFLLKQYAMKQKVVVDSAKAAKASSSKAN